MEVAVPPPPPPPPPTVAIDFNFESNCSSPYITAPSSPQKFNFFFTSAPSSPTRPLILSCLYDDDQFHSHDHVSHVVTSTTTTSAIPFDWEEKPGTPKSSQGSHEDKFEFQFSGHLERNSDISDADELFHRGKFKIQPLKPPPGFDNNSNNSSSISVASNNSPRSPRCPRSPRIIGSHEKSNDFDPFQAAIEATTSKQDQYQQRGIGRQRSARKVSRSLSPMRVSEVMFGQQESSHDSTRSTIISTKSTSNYVSNFLSSISLSRGYCKKWKLKDLLLFRSASEGRASTSRTHDDKSPLTSKYDVLSKKELNSVTDDVKNASFRSTESTRSSRRRSRGAPPVSAHEIHYTANRAVSEELKRKTFLPYKQGLLGCLGFNPGVNEICRGLGSLTRGQT